MQSYHLNFLSQTVVMFIEEVFELSSVRGNGEMTWQVVTHFFNGPCIHVVEKSVGGVHKKKKRQ